MPPSNGALVISVVVGVVVDVDRSVLIELVCASAVIVITPSNAESVTSAMALKAIVFRFIFMPPLTNSVFSYVY
jgi:hypothetical protein